MEHISSELLQEEQQTIPQEEQNQKEDQTQYSESDTPRKTSNFQAVFEMFSGAVMGVCSSVGILVLIVAIGWWTFAICEDIYDHWFGDLYGCEIGQNGLVCVDNDNAIMKTSPNRKVLTNITELIVVDDSTGIVCFEGKEGVLDLNTAKFLLLAQYDKLRNTEKKHL